MIVTCRKCGRTKEIPDNDLAERKDVASMTELCQQCEPPFVFNAQTAQEMILRIAGRPQ